MRRSLNNEIEYINQVQNTTSKKRKIIRNDENKIQNWRFLVQTLSVLLSIWIGIEFYLFVQYLESGGKTIFIERPPGVEGYLPISSLMSLRYFFATGEIHWAHPAGLFIFSAIVLVSLVFGKSFCSWLCPIGFLSETLGAFGDKIFKGKIKLPRVLDYPLRSLKYLLLAFFLYVIFFVMDIVSLKLFLDSPYNQVADIKMYYFFAHISRFSLTVIVVIAVLSVIFKNFWCRYLCPYGALLGIMGLLSPYKIKRNSSSCIDCGLCDKACPAFIKVAKSNYVVSDECSMCLSCVDSCPVKDTLYVKNIFGKSKTKSRYVAIGIVSVFLLVTGLGMISGNWKNKIPLEKYFYHIEKINTSEYSHPTGTSEFKNENK